MAVKKQHSLSNLVKFVSFLSFSGNGSSLISSLIDAHKHALVSREQLLLVRLYKRTISKNHLVTSVIAHSIQYSRLGRPHKGSNSYHKVPNQYNGASGDVRVLGDKSAYGTALNLVNSPKFLSTVSSTLGLPIYFIHTYRNPYDVTAHMRKFYTKYSMDETVNRITHRYSIIDRALSLVNGHAPILSINFNHFVSDPEHTLTQVLNFISLSPYSNYLKDCSSIVKPALLHEASDVSWTDNQLSKISNLCSSLPYLSCFKN